MGFINQKVDFNTLGLLRLKLSDFTQRNQQKEEFIMGSEQQRISGIIENMARGNETRRKITVDKDNKRIVPTPIKGHDPDNYLNITPEDAKLYSGTSEHTGIIVVSGEIIKEMSREVGERSFFLRARMMETFSTY